MKDTKDGLSNIYREVKNCPPVPARVLKEGRRIAHKIRQAVYEARIMIQERREHAAREAALAAGQAE